MNGTLRGMRTLSLAEVVPITTVFSLKLYIDAVNELALPKIMKILEEKGFKTKPIPPSSAIAYARLSRGGSVNNIISTISVIASANLVKAWCYECWARTTVCPCEKSSRINSWRVCTEVFEGVQMYIRCGRDKSYIRPVLTGLLRDVINPPSTHFTSCFLQENLLSAAEHISRTLSLLDGFIKWKIEKDALGVR
ncbi:hypothetical protein ACSU1N_03045 [Thermogladius sp. 4427co]|uniref:hypothetical protein n=1 Tax=Thermogladius sp. 4427co TaxID=3450718 RepID=UPI003F7AD660